MVARAIVTYADDIAIGLLLCNCRRVIKRTNWLGVVQVLIVKARSWDCPSCGLDKRRKIAAMVGEHGAQAMGTVTWEQPMAFDVSGRSVTPQGFEQCSRLTHVYFYVPRYGRGRVPGYRWRVLATCVHCCRRKQRLNMRLRKRIRRKYGDDVQWLWVGEDQKNGALHLHYAISGVPARSARFRRWWRSNCVDLGAGGRSRIDPPKQRATGGSLGSYLGKYLAKAERKKVARRFRRWGRTREYAPDLRMVDQGLGDGQGRRDCPPGWCHWCVNGEAHPPASLLTMGWLHPLLPDVVLARRLETVAA